MFKNPIHIFHTIIPLCECMTKELASPQMGVDNGSSKYLMPKTISYLDFS